MIRFAEDSFDREGREIKDLVECSPDEEPVRYGTEDTEREIVVDLVAHLRSSRRGLEVVPMTP
ncbi:hypothetical protein [Edaphobacter modestus]|uniref:hypothetical protein n=1 Tax=Edaphobacter modestus TaxID=388466 RepID=UPI00102C60AD|nr:hypothetical protein [Edaphobacter modestus]